ncbi:MAG: hypothetical protein ACOYNF_13320 [Rhodoferax sp.]
MNQSSNPPMQQALNKPKDSSSDVETWYRELVSERALHDEATLIQAAEQRGMLKGLRESKQEGKQEGLQDALIKMVANGFPEAQARSILGL